MSSVHQASISIRHGAADAGVVWVTGDGHAIHRGPSWDGPMTGLTGPEAAEQAFVWHAEETRQLVALLTALTATQPDAADAENPQPCPHSDHCGGDQRPLRAALEDAVAAWTHATTPRRWKLSSIGSRLTRFLYRADGATRMGKIAREADETQWHVFDDCHNSLGAADSAVGAAAMLCAERARQDINEAQRVHRVTQRYEPESTLMDCLSKIVDNGYTAAMNGALADAHEHAQAGNLHIEPGFNEEWVHVYEPDEGHIGLLRRGPGHQRWRMYLAGLEFDELDADTTTEEASQELRSRHRTVTGTIAQACADTTDALPPGSAEAARTSRAALRGDEPWIRESTSGCHYDVTHTCDDWGSYGQRHTWQDAVREWAHLLGRLLEANDPPRIEPHPVPNGGNGETRDVYTSAAGTPLGRIDIDRGVSYIVTAPDGVRISYHADAAGGTADGALSLGVAFLYKEHAANVARRALSEHHDLRHDPAQQRQLIDHAYPHGVPPERRLGAPTGATLD